MFKGFLISSSWDRSVESPWETDVTKTFEKLSVGGGLTGNLLVEVFDLIVVSSEDGVPERRLFEFCSSKDFSDDERSTPN